MDQGCIATDSNTLQPRESDYGTQMCTLGKEAKPASGVCGRGKHVSSVALVTKNPLAIKVRSDQLTSRILLGLLDSKRYIRYPIAHLSEYVQTLPHGKGTICITFSPLHEEPWEYISASLFMLGDELVDTFLALIAVALDINGPEYINTPFTIRPDDILAICQKKQSKGSYSYAQRQKVMKQIQVLTRASVDATLTLYRGEERHVKSSLLDIMMTGQIYDSTVGCGYEHSPHLHLKVGDWATAIPELQFQTVMLSRQVLQYHAKEQKHEKRLGRYLTLLYRINAHKNEGYVKVSMGVLLEQSRIALDCNNPGRTRDAIEHALDQLYIDGVIGSFSPIVEHSLHGQQIQSRIEQHAYHWWDDYRRQLWLFAPPEYLRVVYHHRSRKVDIPE